MDRYLKKTLIIATTTTIDTSLDSAKIIGIENTISDDTDDSSNEENVPPKRRKQYKHIFNNDWTKQFAWLKNIKPDSKLGKAFCILCNKTLSGNFFHIKRHENSCVHKNNVKVQKSTPNINCSLSKISQKKDSLQQKERELKMIAFIAEHNLPISIMDHFPAFLKSMCPESKLIQNIQCGRTKANLILRDIFRQENIMVLSEQMKQNYFSLIIDETTDVGIQKSLVVCVRLVGASSVKDHFLTLMSLENSTAQCITDKIIEFLNSFKIPLQNMIGFAADNASVMMGNISGVQARLRKNLCLTYLYLVAPVILFIFAVLQLVCNYQELWNNLLEIFITSSAIVLKDIQSYRNFKHLYTLNLISCFDQAKPVGCL